MNNPTVESIVYKYFVRYNRLDGAIRYAFPTMEPNDLNIFIDLYGLYRTIYSRSCRTLITDYVSFTSSVVNLCIHYRSFFKKIGIRSKIFLISSFNTPDHNKIMINGYNKTMDEKRTNKMIADMMSLNFDLLSVLCPYLPDIHFIRTEFESSVLMYDIMQREDPRFSSLIITTDLYPLQICTLRENTALLWPRWVRNEKGETEDISPICPPIGHPEHVLSFSYIIHRINGKTTSEQLKGSVIPSNFILLEALNRFKDRDIPVLFNVSTATKIINETPGGLTNKLYPMDIAAGIAAHDPRPELIDIIQNRFRALDLEFQYSLFKDSLEFKSLHYENLTDPDALNLINEKYFTNNPIDLLRL